MTWRSLGDSNPCFRRERARCLLLHRGHSRIAISVAMLPCPRAIRSSQVTRRSRPDDDGLLGTGMGEQRFVGHRLRLGQLSLAAGKRASVARTVEADIPIRRAISRVGMPPTNCVLRRRSAVTNRFVLRVWVIMSAVQRRCIGMILSTHAVVGAALASFVPSHPLAALVIGFASHFALDAIPHRDYPIKSRSVNPKIAAPMVVDRAFV
jgi:hypothetical protein